MRRDEWVTVQGPVKKQQPDGMSHRGAGGGGDPPDTHHIHAWLVRGLDSTPAVRLCIGVQFNLCRRG